MEYIKELERIEGELKRLEKEVKRLKEEIIRKFKKVMERGGWEYALGVYVRGGRGKTWVCIPIEFIGKKVGRFEGLKTYKGLFEVKKDELRTFPGYNFAKVLGRKVFRIRLKPGLYLATDNEVFKVNIKEWIAVEWMGFRARFEEILKELERGNYEIVTISGKTSESSTS